MSRCFPYPRNGASSSSSYEALIQSIKLQKETERALKAERKKEKREKKEKKHKHKEKNGEKGKSQSNQNELQQDSHKSLQIAAKLKEADAKVTRPDTEQLEKSDLSEEHGPAINPQKPSYSSDSTQNSNKRKRDDSILPDASSGYGKPIKIRLLKKHKGPEEVPMEIDQPVPLATRPFNETLVIHNRKTSGFPATYGRENSTLSLPETKNDALQGLHFGRKQPAASSSRVIPPGAHLEHQTPSSLINNIELPVLHSSRQPSVSGYGRTVPVSRVDLDLPGPSSVVPPAPSASRKIDVQGVHLDSNMSRAPATGKLPINELTAPVKDGLTRLEKQKDPISEAPPPTRHEKKIRKKHLKYEKLIGSWVPPLLEALQKPADDEDWLSRRVRTVKSSSRDNVEPCQELTASSLWQPCARFLVDADIHALPFTVPF